ncbi:MAG: A/G-specific adenine glycosylase [Pseudomonadota bacterium]
MSVELGGLPAMLLDWYGRHARDLPWRIGPMQRARGVRPDPYRVWLAEIMLQQTTIPHATRYFAAFTARWPRIEDLASAKDDEVMAAWAGLGYYARARNLLKCAREVARSGAFPTTETELLTLPGIGPYTAGAVAALAFGRRTAAVDGNVERVFARVLALDAPFPKGKAAIRPIVERLVPADRPAEFAEGLMDLGATVCTPKSPNCLICPLRPLCSAHEMGTPDAFPKKEKKTPKPTRYGVVFVVSDGQSMLVERRPERGLLGGMLGLPGTEWRESAPSDFKANAPEAADWRHRGEIRHVFTHFTLILEVWRSNSPPKGLTLSVNNLDDLPSVFKKAARLALD